MNTCWILASPAPGSFDPSYKKLVVVPLTVFAVAGVSSEATVERVHLFHQRVAYC